MFVKSCQGDHDPSPNIAVCAGVLRYFDFGAKWKTRRSERMIPDPGNGITGLFVRNHNSFVDNEGRGKVLYY